MRRVIDQSESFKRTADVTRPLTSTRSLIPVAIADAIQLMCEEAPVTKIVAITRSGFAAQTLSQERVTPVLLLTAYSDREFVDRAVDAGVMGYLVKPFAEAQLKPAIEVALARFQEMQALQRENAGLQERLEARKLVDRAKGKLMDEHGMKEVEAFTFIRTQAMNARVTLGEVAQRVLDGQLTP